MSEVLLDRDGALPLPPGYTQVKTEVEFLRLATSDVPLLIQGDEHLCAWAYDFYTARGRACRYVESPLTALRRAFPELTDEQARSLAGKLGQVALSEPILPERVLEHCYPASVALWFGAPSKEHAARWLLWLYEHRPTDAEAVVLRAWAAVCAAQAPSAPIAALYQATDALSAEAKLLAWLGAEGDYPAELSEFPLRVPDSLPDSLLDKVKGKWRERLVESRGEALETLLALPLPLSLTRALAETATIYFEANPGVLDQAKIRALAPHLPTPGLDALIEKQPPPPPTFPADPDEQTVLDWFQAQYLPFRRWQAQHGDERAQATAAVESAQRFASWYLARYPQWLLNREQGWIAFQRSNALSRASDALVLCVVLDGLPAWDAEDFARDLLECAERLCLLERGYCFAPFPTVTEFAKAALLRGDPPRLAQLSDPLAEVLSDRDDPAAHLASCPLGAVRFWSLSQPDNAYHFEAEHKRAAKVHGELGSLIERLRAVVERVPDERTLQIVLTTDHGRLLNKCAPCDKPVPSGMRAHGRAAWGGSGRRFPAEGFCVEDTSGLCFVHGERFGVPEEVAFVWDESAFQNDKRTGSEPYPHGGLFPEEAIVPWFVFERDARPPEFKVEITGAGESGGSGELRLTVTNLSRVALMCESVALSHAANARAEPALRVPPLGATTCALRLAPWPGQADCEALIATLTFRLPNGKRITHKVRPALEARVLYRRDESLLKELDL